MVKQKRGMVRFLNYCPFMKEARLMKSMRAIKLDNCFTWFKVFDPCLKTYHERHSKRSACVTENAQHNSINQLSRTLLVEEAIGSKNPEDGQCDCHRGAANHSHYLDKLRLTLKTNAIGLNLVFISIFGISLKCVHPLLKVVHFHTILHCIHISFRLTIKAIPKTHPMIEKAIPKKISFRTIHAGFPKVSSAYAARKQNKVTNVIRIIKTLRSPFWTLGILRLRQQGSTW